MTLETWIGRILYRIEARVTLPSDANYVKRQKVFLWVGLFNSCTMATALLPFAVIYSGVWPACHDFSCLWLPTLLALLVVSLSTLLILMKYKSILWPRRIHLTCLLLVIPFLLLSHGGFEKTCPVMSMVAYDMLITLILYGDFKTPAKWMSAVFFVMTVLGLFELGHDPFTAYTYTKRLIVIEYYLESLLGIPLFFFAAWYLLYHLRLEIEQRKRAEALALEESQAKASFLARMSHEIRSPLNGVIGFLELLEKTKMDHVQTEYVRYIHTSSKQLLNVLNDILTFSKLEAGKVTLEKKAFNLRQCLEAAVDTVRGQAEAKHNEVILHVPHDCPTSVIGDEFRLTQVLTNLLNNACKFTTEGFVEMLVDSQNTEGTHSSFDNSLPSAPLFATSEAVSVFSSTSEPISSPSSVVFNFAVRDSGVGMSEAQQRLLFEPFAQADVSTTRQYGGTGLGLSICQQLVQLWNGWITCHSEGLGRGSQFTFTYPMVVRESSTAASPLGEPATRLMPLRSAVIVDSMPPRASAMRELLLCFTTSVVVASSLSEVHRGYNLLVITVDERSSLEALEVNLQQHLGSGNLGSCDVASKPVVLGVTSLSRLQEVEAVLGIRCFAKPLSHAQLQSFITHVPAAATPNTSFSAASGVCGDAGTGSSMSSMPGVIAISDVSSPTSLPGGQRLLPKVTSLNSVAGPVPTRLPTALVVDDLEVNRILLASMLQQHCHVMPTCVDSGAAALQLCQHAEVGRFDVVFLDCHMPGMSGYETARRLRQLPPTAGSSGDGDGGGSGSDGAFAAMHSVPIVAVTAAAPEQDRLLCRESGMDYFLAKPISISGVRDILAQAGVTQGGSRNP